MFIVVDAMWWGGICSGVVDTVVPLDGCTYSVCTYCVFGVCDLSMLPVQDRFCLCTCRPLLRRRSFARLVVVRCSVPPPDVNRLNSFYLKNYKTKATICF